MIAPGDSFVATFTPPRAGTFIYHTHMNDLGQMAAGMYGALVVLEPGEKWNDTTDHVFAVGQSGLIAPAWTVVNGRPAQQPIVIKAGVPHRFRFLSMTIDEETDVSIARRRQRRDVDAGGEGRHPDSLGGAHVTPGEAPLRSR